MVYEKNSVILTERSSFDFILDTACQRLEEKHIRYTIRRISEMDDKLAMLEKELDEFIGQKRRGPGEL